MTIVNVGVSYRTAPAEVLERLAIPAAELGGVLARLHAVPGIDEVAVLSTCNRVEAYAAAVRAARTATRAVTDLMAARGGIRAERDPAVGPGPGRRRGRRALVLGGVRAGLDGRR